MRRGRRPHVLRGDGVGLRPGKWGAVQESEEWGFGALACGFTAARGPQTGTVLNAPGDQTLPSTEQRLRVTVNYRRLTAGRQQLNAEL